MKRIIWGLLGTSLIIGAVLCLNRRGAVAVPVAQPLQAESLGPCLPQSWEATHADREPIAVTAQAQSATSLVSVERGAGRSSGLEKSLVAEAVDILVSPQATYEQKRSTWKQLKEAGKLDQAIAELEQRVAADPRSAENAAALGQAYLQKCGTIQDVREQGILAMQADKLFDSALSLDPSNWEARFTKAMALSYWPATMGKGEEVIQHFQTLIQQQETQPPQPQYAETYLWLGNQYEKAGRTDEAQAIWERGARLFPQNENLTGKLVTAQ